MDIEVDTDQLLIMEKDIKKSANSFVEEIDLWKKQIEELKKIWQGEADIFYSKIDEYLIKLNMISETEKIIGNVIKDSYNMYEEKDNLFTQQLKRDNSQYDDEEFAAKAGKSGRTEGDNA